MKRTTRISSSILVTTALALSACGGGGGAGGEGEVELNIAHVFTDGTPISKSAVNLAEGVEDATDGRVAFRPFGNSQLGADTELAESLVNGSLDCAILNHPASGLDPKLQLGFLPYIVSSYDEADQIFYDDGFVAQYDRKVLEEDHDLTVLTFVENDFRAVSNGDTTVSDPNDLAGLKIRVPELPMYINLFKAWGAQPVAMAYAELYGALQQGTVDGQDNGPIVTSDSKFSEVQDDFTTTNHAYAAAVITCSNSALKDISAEDLAAIKDVAAQVSIEERAENRKVAAERIQQLADEGVEVTDLTDGQRAQFAQVKDEIWDGQSDVFGADTIDGLRKASEQISD